MAPAAWEFFSKVKDAGDQRDADALRDDIRLPPAVQRDMTPPMSLLLRIILPFALAIFLVDRLSKIWIVDWLDLQNRLALDVVPPFLNLRMAWNTGINFGIGGGGPDAMRWVLVGLSVVISIALLWWVMRRNERALAFGAGAVIGGAIGNAWDRVQWGAVADFLNMSCCGIHNPFSFNVADIAIFMGAMWIAWKA